MTEQLTALICAVGFCASAQANIIDDLKEIDELKQCFRQLFMVVDRNDGPKDIEAEIEKIVQQGMEKDKIGEIHGQCKCALRSFKAVSVVSDIKTMDEVKFKYIGKRVSKLCGYR